MKLIVEYNETDGCTYNCYNTLPIEYESRNKFHRDFEEYCYNQKKIDFSDDVGFLNTGLYAGQFFEDGVYYPPIISYLEYWFELNKKGNL